MLLKLNYFIVIITNFAIEFESDFFLINTKNKMYNTIIALLNIIQFKYLTYFYIEILKFNVTINQILPRLNNVIRPKNEYVQ